MALAAGLGFRPALLGPGRSLGFAVHTPLRKPTLRRLAAAEQPAPQPPATPSTTLPLPTGEPQPPSQQDSAVVQLQRRVEELEAKFARAEAAGQQHNASAAGAQPAPAQAGSFSPAAAQQPSGGANDEAAELAAGGNQLRGTVSQAALGAMRWWYFNPSKWLKLMAIGACLLTASSNVQNGNTYTAIVNLCGALLILLTPWSD